MEDRELSQTEIDQLVAYQLKKLDKEYHATVNAKILTVEESKTATQEKHTCTKLRANSIQEEDIKPNNQWEQFEEKDDDDEAGYETLSDDDGKEKDDEKEEVVAWFDFSDVTVKQPETKPKARDIFIDPEKADKIKNAMGKLQLKAPAWAEKVPEEIWMKNLGM